MSTKSTRRTKETPVKPIDAEFVGSPAATQADPLPGNHNGQQLMRVEHAHVAVSLARDPLLIINEAQRAAQALMTLINAKPKKDQVIMNGKKYLVFEDWQTVGRFFNLVPRIREDRLIQIDLGVGKMVTGYEATADAVDVVSGATISSATGMCLNDEEKWSSRTKYAWLCVCKDGSFQEDPPKEQIQWVPNPSKPGKSMPLKQRVKIGEESVPLFQLRSMAQTRACAKAMRNALAWVPVMVGYSPTPAEELTGPADPIDDDGPPDAAYDEPKPAPAPAKAPPKAAQSHPTPPVAAQTPPPPPPAGAVRKISDKQVRRWWTIARSNKWTNDQIHRLILKEWNIDHTEDIPAGAAHYDRVVDTILLKGPEACGYGKGIE